LLYILQESADQIEAAEKFKDEYSLMAGIKCLKQNENKKKYFN